MARFVMIIRAFVISNVIKKIQMAMTAGNKNTCQH